MATGVQNVNRIRADEVLTRHSGQGGVEFVNSVSERFIALVVVAPSSGDLHKDRL